MSITTPTDRLHQIRVRARNARGAVSRAREQFDAARAAGDNDAAAVGQLALDAAHVELQTAEQLERVLLGQMAGVSHEASHQGGIFDDPSTVATLERLGNSSMAIGRVDLGPLSTVQQLVQKINAGDWGPTRRAESNDGPSGLLDIGDAGRVGPFYGFVPQPRRRLRLLDLIPTSPMSGRSFGYFQDEGDLDSGAAEVAEGDIKPMADLGLDEQEVVARVIAVWIKMLRPQLADLPELARNIQDRLQYLCLRRLENQIIGGDGAGENIQGILHTTGVAEVDFSATEPLSDLALDGITDVLMSDVDPDAVVLNPVDLASMLKATGDDGHRLDGDGAFGTVPDRLWGLPIVPSTAMPVGEALVGAFATGCRLFIREAVNVRLSDADQDDFVRNRVTALAELRAGLAVFLPTAFCIVKLAA